MSHQCYNKRKLIFYEDAGVGTHLAIFRVTIVFIVQFLASLLDLYGANRIRVSELQSTICNLQSAIG